jgi:hypothetical protein
VHEGVAAIDHAERYEHYRREDHIDQRGQYTRPEANVFEPGGISAGVSTGVLVCTIHDNLPRRVDEAMLR